MIDIIHDFFKVPYNKINVVTSDTAWNFDAFMKLYDTLSKEALYTESFGCVTYRGNKYIVEYVDGGLYVIYFVSTTEDIALETIEPHTVEDTLTI